MNPLERLIIVVGIICFAGWFILREVDKHKAEKKAKDEQNKQNKN